MPITRTLPLDVLSLVLGGFPVVVPVYSRVINPHSPRDNA